MLINCYVYKLHELLIVVHVYMCTILYVWDKILANDRYWPFLNLCFTKLWFKNLIKYIFRTTRNHNKDNLIFIFQKY